VSCRSKCTGAVDILVQQRTWSQPIRQSRSNKFSHLGLYKEHQHVSNVRLVLPVKARKGGTHNRPSRTLCSSSRIFYIISVCTRSQNMSIYFHMSPSDCFRGISHGHYRKELIKYIPIVGLISTFSFSIVSLKSHGERCPSGSIATIFFLSFH
jgi:hypothetical protein